MGLISDIKKLKRDVAEIIRQRYGISYGEYKKRMEQAKGSAMKK